MAHKMENDVQGYDPKRFEHPVQSETLCCICCAVLRNPRMCPYEHMFCLACISRHLRNSATCPTCGDHLTPETLRRVPRFVRDYVLELKISCNYKYFGCPYYVELENLERHVDQCLFAPANAMLMNGKLKNKRYEDIHDEDSCQKEIQEEKTGTEDKIAGTKRKQDEMNDKVNQIQENVDEIKQDQAKMKASQDEMEVKLNSIKVKIDDMNDKVNQIIMTNVDEGKRILAKLKASRDEMMAELNRTNFHIAGIHRKQDEVNSKVDHVKENVDKMQQVFAAIKADRVSLEAEKVPETLNGPLLENNVNNNAIEAAQAYSATNEEIIILDGYHGPRGDGVSNTVEKCNVAEGNSVELPPMNIPRAESASCVHKSQ